MVLFVFFVNHYGTVVVIQGGGERSSNCGSQAEFRSLPLFVKKSYRNTVIGLHTVYDCFWATMLVLSS